MKVLLTAFEPFGGESVNAAWEAAKALCPPEGMTVSLLCVPTIFGAAAKIVIDAVQAQGPDAVVMLGQAAGRSAITPERIAINVRDARLPDNACHQPVEEPVVPDGPLALRSTLPIHAMRDAMERVGVPAAISNTAGTFVCNDLMYGVLYAASALQWNIPCGFLHVPCMPVQGAAHVPPLPSMPTETVVKGLSAALSALL